MTINLENPAIFSGDGFVKIIDENTVEPVDTVCKTCDYIRLITEPMDLIPGAHDAIKEVLHLEPGDILLTFRDWDLNEHDTTYYRVAIKNDKIKEYLTELNEYRKNRIKNKQSASITECGCADPLI